MTAKLKDPNRKKRNNEFECNNASHYTVRGPVVV